MNFVVFPLFFPLFTLFFDLIWTQAGLAAARARGCKGGRSKVLDKDKRDVAVDLYNQKKLTIEKICEMMEITKPTLYKYINRGLPKVSQTP